MTSTTTTNSTNGQIIYLPAPTGVTNSWANSTTWTQTNLIFDENGAKIVEQISKVQAFMIKYKDLINGVIFAELIEKINALLYEVSCMWGLGVTGNSWSNSWSNNWSYTTPAYTCTPSAWINSIGGSSWVVLDNTTTAATTGITYTY